MKTGKLLKAKVVLVVLLLCSIAIIYTISYRIDLFPWGSSKSDGLFMIIIPIWILPIIYLDLLIKWLFERRLKVDCRIENYVYLISSTLIGVFVLFDIQFLYWICVILSVLMIIRVMLSIIRGRQDGAGKCV